MDAMQLNIVLREFWREIRRDVLAGLAMAADGPGPKFDKRYPFFVERADALIAALDGNMPPKIEKALSRDRLVELFKVEERLALQTGEITRLKDFIARLHTSEGDRLLAELDDMEEKTP